MAVLTAADKEKIKRVIPKNTNKIIDATVARLYIAYPDPTEWKYTGLSGSIVLVDDLVGHTFFLKLVDIIGNRGVIWDQELYVDFQYNQDRSFFHSFEIDECYVGLLFEDKSEASHFFKRVSAKEKHGSKKTIQNKNAIALKKKPDEEKRRALRGDMSSHPSGPTNEQRQRRTRGIIYYDDQPPPEWRSFYKELENMGITEEMIADNREFIKDYISQQGGPLVGLEPPIPRKFQVVSKNRTSTVTSTNSSNSTPNGRRKKAPPPPPPPGGSASPSPAPQSQPSSGVNTPARVVSGASTSENPIVFNTLAAPTKHNVPPPFPSSNTVHSVPPPLPPKNNTSAPPPLPPLPGRGPVPSPPARGPVPPPPARGAVPPPPPSRGASCSCSTSSKKRTSSTTSSF
ncbi:unnamed protein product [Ambrosiozyma monospora]|uniref:Unnamed protein product n=1 Tax=Ambrosiozyma monospora TaxID=43982 RepID=A0A9W6YXC9_AMBMO|nr:unnamed protein product [Ambrosiozyma monospora]